MDKLIIKTLVELRIIVGYLGEKSQYNWWPSNFLAPTTQKMLEFTFPRTAQISQYMALSAAAAKVHDEAIGIGKSLLQYLFKITKNSRLLVGTWQDASWAISFYLKNGFVLHTRKQTDQLLERYWQVPLRQMETSVVLEKQMWKDPLKSVEQTVPK